MLFHPPHGAQGQIILNFLRGESGPDSLFQKWQGFQECKRRPSEIQFDKSLGRHIQF